MLEVLENALLVPEISRHFVSEMLCFYFTVMVSLASAGLIILILESVEQDDF